MTASAFEPGPFMNPNHKLLMVSFCDYECLFRTNDKKRSKHIGICCSLKANIPFIKTFLQVTINIGILCTLSNYLYVFLSLNS